MSSFGRYRPRRSAQARPVGFFVPVGCDELWTTPVAASLFPPGGSPPGSH
jgi:hypothetical protein